MKISWTKRAKRRSFTQSQDEKEQADIRKQRKANCIGYILCTNCIPKYIIEEQIEDEKTRKET
jgi:hypothetical protein